MMLIRTFLVLALTSQVAVAQPYKWIDAQGRTHYGDRPPAEAKARPVAAAINTYSGTPVLNASGKPAPSALQREALVIYTTPSCGYCQSAKAHMSQRGIPYTERDVTISESYEREFRQKGGRGVPLIVAGSRTLNGYSHESLEALLKGAGY
ncbi:MAG: glutaredoxin family protein [Rhodocyclaceae bacterium]|nr:glutaredoxin family protein [Rhodocyclaceae bacterium]